MSKHAHSTDDRCQFYHPQQKLRKERKKNRLFFQSFSNVYAKSSASYLFFYSCALYTFMICSIPNTDGEKT